MIDSVKDEIIKILLFVVSVVTILLTVMLATPIISYLLESQKVTLSIFLHIPKYVVQKYY